MNYFKLGISGAFFVIVVFTIMLWLPSGSALSQEESITTSDESFNTSQTNEGYVPDTYDYNVQPTNNMTLFVRRSLQYYDAAVKNLTLTEAQISYAETNIVKDIMAPHLIFPGSDVSITSKIVEQYANSAQDLNESQLEAWQFYADRSSFNLDGISAENVSVDETGNVTAVDDIDSADDAEDSVSESENSEQTSQSSDVLWWVIGIGSIGVLWYLLWQRSAEEE